MITLFVIGFVIWSILFYALLKAYGENPSDEYNRKVAVLNQMLKERHDKATRVSVTGDITYE